MTKTPGEHEYPPAGLHTGGYGLPITCHPPQCPWCGARLSGGGSHTAYYDCGAHIWTLRGNRLAGHPGGTPTCPTEEQETTSAETMVGLGLPDGSIRRLECEVTDSRGNHCPEPARYRQDADCRLCDLCYRRWKVLTVPGRVPDF